jgi:hypothetical protein
MRNILLTTALATLFTGVASAHSAHVGSVEIENRIW